MIIELWFVDELDQSFFSMLTRINHRSNKTRGQLRGQGTLKNNMGM